jgi:hypothetical protein
MQVTTEEIIYPSSDGQPMAESTIQYKLIVKIKEGCESLFKDDPNVFVAADLLWYPVEGRNDISQAPDVMVIFGRQKGDRIGVNLRNWRRDRPQSIRRSRFTSTTPD